MKILAIKIIETLFPVIHDAYSFGVHESCEPMLKTLLELEDNDLIALYDAVVHKHIERN